MWSVFCEYFQAEFPSTGVVAGSVKDSEQILERPQFKNWVKDSHDMLCPINGAQVTLLDTNDKVVGTYTTDNNYNGVYVFWEVKPGDYKVKIDAEGYDTKTLAVKVEASKIADQVTLMSAKK